VQGHTSLRDANVSYFREKVKLERADYFLLVKKKATSSSFALQKAAIACNE
jgi:hypothetical protein